jgi:hypothetical protein
MKGKLHTLCLDLLDIIEGIPRPTTAGASLVSGFSETKARLALRMVRSLTAFSLLCHDIGYVRRVCRGDRNGHYVYNEDGDLVAISAGATDASLTPYHVARFKLFVRERFGKSLTHIDTREIEANIEHTRFPVPEDELQTSTADYPGLLRAADLIGQLADIDYLRKTSALFAEFQETGASEKLGYQTPDDLRAGYPAFFWQAVRPYIGDALRYLQVTQEGKQWIANLYAHVFSEEHRGAFGAH